MLDNVADIIVRVEYADLAKVNRIRAWARRNNAVAGLTPYTKGAYSGTVKIRSPWNEGREVVEKKARELRELLKSQA